MTTTIRPIPVGEPAPWFVGRSLTNPQYHFGSVAGRHVVMFFAGSLGAPPVVEVYRALLAQGELFDDVRCSLFVVTAEESDVSAGRAPREHYIDRQAGETLASSRASNSNARVYPCIKARRLALKTGSPQSVRMALDQVMSDEGAAIREGSEVAFFPPVTGG